MQAEQTRYIIYEASFADCVIKLFVIVLQDVSAVSQVISCHTFDQSVTPASLQHSFFESVAVREGRLALFDCAVVPKKFHALFSATWRR